MLSEIDLKDWIKTDAVKPLWDCPRNTVVSPLNDSTAFFFGRVDGMYSFCKKLSGEVFHPAVWTEVNLWVKNTAETNTK